MFNFLKVKVKRSDLGMVAKTDGFGETHDYSSSKSSSGRSPDVESLDSIHGFVTVEKFGADGSYQLICKDKPNLITLSGRDTIHAQVYTNTSAGRRGCGFIGLTTDVAAASSADTTLAAEITTNGLARADASTKTHSAGTNTTTIQNTFTCTTGAVSAIVKSALFDNPTPGASTSNMIHENTFTTVTLQVNDTLQVTWTITAG